MTFQWHEGITTAAGGLVYSSVRPGGLSSVYLASLDANSRPSEWKRLDLHLGNMLNPNPNWSGDSNQIVYVARNEDTGQTGGQVVHLHNLSSGEDREVYHALGRVFCAWATQQPNLFCTDTAEKTDIFSIAADSREIARLHTFPAPRHLWIRSPSLDNRGLYIYDVLGDGEREVLLWEIATARETVLEQSAPGAYVFVSQDGRWLVRRAKPNIEVRPTSGGAWKSLAALRLSEATGHVNGNWLLYQ